jgi:pimeloyl-ACP methyl ester carboxylesterase
VLRALREQFHLDADRTVVLGWSLGGYTAWMWALLHGEELAAAVAIASTTSTPPDDTGLWEAVAPAAAPIPVLTTWGAVDRYPVTAADGGSLGTIAELNRRLRDRHAADPQAAKWRWHELAKLGHGVLELDAELLQPYLGARRDPAPDRVERRFRHLHQGKVWWLEATALGGPLWGEALPKVDRRKGESRREALGRTLLDHLPRLAGSRTLAADGSELISIERHLVDALEIHFECGRLPAPREVVVTEAGAEVFRGTVAPSLSLALLEARQSLDFERLTCAIVVRDATGAWSVKRP